LEQMLNEVDWMRQAVTGSAAKDPRDLLVDVGDTVGEIWDCVAHAQRCAMRFVRESGVWTWADPVELRRAVRNLVENAVRAAGDGVVEVRVSTDGHQVMVEVHDSGPGFGLIPPQEQLGLITVRRFASAHEGRLVIDTSPLGGALVRLELPAMAPSYADDVFEDVHADSVSYLAQRTTA
jgi:signal transduction histidine kinase